MTVTGLQPDNEYTYRLLHRPGPPVVASPIAATTDAGDGARADLFGTETEIVTGTVRTARTSRDRLDFAFTSCHLPAAATSLNRWQHLGNRDEPDLLLLMGDQILPGQRAFVTEPAPPSRTAHRWIRAQSEAVPASSCEAASCHRSWDLWEACSSVSS